MIQNILNGFLSVSITVVNWFLSPIWDLIDNIDLGGTTIGDMFTSFNQLFLQLSGVMSWVIDATGVPRVLFVLLFSIYLICITMRITIYVVKMLLRWWDKIIA